MVNSLSQQKVTARLPKKTGRFDNWLPLANELRNLFSNGSKGVMTTILIAQNQSRDGFMKSTT